MSSLVPETARASEGQAPWGEAYGVWWKYIQMKIKLYNSSTGGKSDSKSMLIHIFTVFERVLKILPGSYKLWNAYIEMRIKMMIQIFTGSSLALAGGRDEKMMLRVVRIIIRQ